MARGQILAFPIDIDRRPYNTLALPCECVRPTDPGGLCGLMVERSLAIQNQKVARSNLGRSASGNSMGQAAHTHVPLSLSSISNKN